MGAKFSRKRDVTTQLICYGNEYTLYDSRKNGKIWVKNEKRRRKNYGERFSNNFQAAFISQLVEIGTGFIDCKVVFSCPVLN